MAKTTLVTFVKDVFPYCKNDVVNVDNDELKAIDTDAYLKGEVIEGEEVTETSKKKATKKA